MKAIVIQLGGLNAQLPLMKPLGHGGFEPPTNWLRVMPFFT